MTLELAKHPQILSRAWAREAVPASAFIELIRASYPDLWRRVVDALVPATETIPIEPGDQLLVSDDRCVVHRDKLLRRKLQRRDEEARELDGEEGPGAGESTIEYHKDIDAPRNGIVSIRWDRSAWGQTLPDEQRSGRILIQTFEPLSSASKEIKLESLTEDESLELVEAFATRCIPVALNAFFGVRLFLVAPDAMLLARPDLHGSERLQELLRNPTRQDSEHLLRNYPTDHPEPFAFFSSLRDEAFASETKRAARDIQGLEPRLRRQILTALAIPQIHDTIGNLLRMQFVLIQPSTIAAATLVAAGAALQVAWDGQAQVQVLAELLRQPS